MKSKILGTAAVLLAAAFTVPAQADVIVAPVTATASSTFSDAGISPVNTINQSGLSLTYISGVTDFDAYMTANPLHDWRFSGQEWFSAAGTSATMDYTFSAPVALTRFALWNEDTSGIGEFDLLIWNGIAFVPVLTGISPINNPAPVLISLGNGEFTEEGTPYPAEIFDFGGPITTTAVRLVMRDCPQAEANTFGACAIGEVAFAAATPDGNGNGNGNGGTGVPAPSALLLVGAGLALLGARNRARI